MAGIIAVSSYFLLFLINGFTSDLIVRQSVQDSQDKRFLQFSIYMENSPVLGGIAYDVLLVSNSTGFAVNPSSIVTDSQYSNRSQYSIYADDYVLWNYSQITNGEVSRISYEVEPQFKLPVGKSYYDASLTYSVNPPVNGTGFWGPVLTQFCLERVDAPATETSFNKGLIAVTVVFGFLAGIFVVLLILFAFFRLTKRHPCLRYKKSSASSTESLQIEKNPSEFSDKAEKSKFTEMQQRSPRKKASPWTDSIITILRMPDRNDIIREIERLDIEDTARFYDEIKHQKNEALTNLAINLAKNLDSESKAKKLESKYTASLLIKLESLEKKMDNKFEDQTTNDRISRREGIERQLEAISEKHNKELEFFMDYLNGKHNHDEIRPLRKLLAKKQQLEQKLLQYRNDLEDQEYMQKTLSDISVEKDNVRRKFLLEYLSDVANAASMAPEHLLMEYAEQETFVQKLFNDAEAVQLRLLEEKFAKRKCFVKTQELSRIHGKDLLNTMTSQLIQLIGFAKKSGKLSQSNARRVKEDVLTETEEIKMHRDTEIEKREIDLLKRLGSNKRNRILDKIKQHENELQELQKKGKAVQMKDFLHFLETIQRKSTQHRQEIFKLENEIDSEHAADLLKIHELLEDEVKQELLKSKETLVKDLKETGIPSTKIKPFLEYLDDDLKELKLRHLKETKEQFNNLKKQLSDGAIKLSGSRQQKFQIQDQLATYKQIITRKLLNGQIFLSSEERKELETSLIKVQKGATVGLLALDKLKYRKMIEVRQAALEKEKLDKLEIDLKKKLRSLDKNQSGVSDDENDERNQDSRAIILPLFESYFQQCLSVLRGEEIVPEEEEEVSRELNKEQAIQLKEEEDNLAEHLVQLQMRKVKQLVLLENQRTILHDTTSGLMKELVERNILSLSDCVKLLQLHDKELRSVVAHRNDEAKVKTLAESRMKELEDGLKNTADDLQWQSHAQKSALAEKLVKTFSQEEQLIKRNVANNHLERETRQDAEEMKRTDCLCEKRLILEKELELLATVMKGAGYDNNEVEAATRSHLTDSILFDWKDFLDRHSPGNKSQHPAQEKDPNYRTVLKPGKLHPLPSSVYPAPAYNEMDTSTTSTSKAKSFLYQKPHYAKKERLSQTLPSHLMPITPAVGSKQKKSVRLVETSNEYWSS